MALSRSKTRDVGDYFPQMASSPCTSNEDLPQLPHFPQEAQCITPRACRFSNLNDAHRNITGRSFSNTRKVSSGDDTTSSDDIALRDLSSSRSLGVHPENMVEGRHDFPCSKIQGRSLTKSTKGSSGSFNVQHRGVENSSPLSIEANNRYGNGMAAVITSESSDNTVDRIYKQYQRISGPQEGSSTIEEVPSSPESDHSTINAGGGRDGATNRCGFRPDEVDARHFETSDDVMPVPAQRSRVSRPDWDWPESDGEPSRDFNTQWTFPILKPQGDAPTLSLPKLPDLKPTERLGPPIAAVTEQQSSLQSPSDSVSNTDILLSGAFEGPDEALSQTHDEADDKLDDEPHSLFPMPLRLESMKSAGGNFGYLSSLASAGGMTTESDDDPFKYDKQSYAVFLQPSKEREVSAALRRVSGVSGHSKGTVCSPDGSPYRTSLRPPPIPQDLVERLNDGSSEKRFSTRRHRGAFYDASAIKPGMGEDGGTSGVKVVMRTASVPINDLHATSGGDKGILNDKNLGLDGSNDAQRGETTNEPDDWQTVATSGAGLGSTGLSLPSRAPVNSHGIKVAGSSIADVSDDASFYDAPFDDVAASTDQIIQHPSDASLKSFRVRRVQGSTMPVFVAKPRVHRVNGFAQDSCRLFSRQGTGPSATNTGSSLARKLSNSFRQLNVQRKHKYTSSAHHKDKDNRRSHFNFRKSRESSTHFTSKLKSKRLERESVGSRKSLGSRKTQARKNHSRIHPVVTNRDSTDNDTSETTQSSDTSHGFSFNLISLPEASRLQAIRRASGLDDQTETGHLRARRAVSQASTKHTHGTMAIGPQLPRVPESTYQRKAPGLLPITSPTFARAHRRGRQGNHREKENPAHSPSLSSTATTETFHAMGALDGTVGPKGGRSSAAAYRPVRSHETMYTAYEAPRLYKTEERRRIRAADPQLRALAGLEAGLPMDPDAYLSYEAKHRRRAWFFFMLLISIFPFMAILAYKGTFDNALSWYTKGEVHTLTDGQKRIIRVVMIFQFILWPVLLFGLIWHYHLGETASTASH